MANSGDDQELQNETTVRLMALSLSEKAFVVVSAIVYLARPRRTHIRFGHGHSVKANTFSCYPFFRSHQVEEREED